MNDKMDQIAAVASYNDAMENQGLLIYDPNFLLAAPTAQLSHKQFVAMVVAHEISHQVGPPSRALCRGARCGGRCVDFGLWADAATVTAS